MTLETKIAQLLAEHTVRHGEMVDRVNVYHMIYDGTTPPTIMYNIAAAKHKIDVRVLEITKDVLVDRM